MYLWAVVTVLGPLHLASVVIQWMGRIRYEHARAALATAMANAVVTGGVICDERADGTILRVVIPPSMAIPPRQPTPCALAGDILATPR